MTGSTSTFASATKERAAPRDTVLLVGFPEEEAARITDASQLDAEIVVAADERAGRALLEKRAFDVLCLGGGLPAEAARRFLEQVAGPVTSPVGALPVNVVLAAGPRLEIFQDLVDHDRLYYLTQKPPAPADVISILESAVEHQRRREAPAPSDDDDERDLAVHRILRLTEPLAREADLTAAVARAIKAVEQLILAESARILLYDPTTETLWSPARLDSDQRFGQRSEEEESRESAAAGVVSFAVRTRRTVRLERVGEDPRYDADADTAGGPSDQRFLAAPVIDPAGRRVWAVLVGLRSAEREPFSATDAEHLGLFAEQVAPLLGRLLQQAELEERASQRHGIGQGEAAQIFRGEALEFHMQGFENQGHVLEISPSWTRWAYRLLLGIVVVAVVFSLVIPIHEYAAGIAVVRLEGRTDVTSSLSGTAVAVEVEPGRRVATGDLLVRLYGAQEAAELERIERELELELANRLRNPADLSAERALGALRAQKRLAEQRLEERSIRAPRAGVVSDVWVKAGQLLSPGQVVLALEHQDPKLGIVALLPGQYRPVLEPGQILRLELEGYRYAYQHLEIAAIGDEVVGPTEARRALGAGIADAVPIAGPVVFVYADLLERTCESDGRVYAYHDGILGTAEVRIRSEPILLTLVPGLKVVPGIDLLVRDEGKTAMNEESR